MKPKRTQSKRKFHIQPWPVSQVGPQSSRDIQEDAEANYFAACLLISEYKLREILSITRELPLIADYFGVPIELLEMRIHDLRSAMIYKESH